jgi:hypothetical protein
MGLWDEFKDILGRIKLVEIKNEVHMHGDINMPFKGDTIHQSVTQEERTKISSTDVTPDLEKEYHRKMRELVEARKAYFESLPAEKRERVLTQTSIASAVSVLSTSTTTTTPPPSKSSIMGSEGEGCDSTVIISPSTNFKKSGGFDDSGETM